MDSDCQGDRHPAGSHRSLHSGLRPVMVAQHGLPDLHLPYATVSFFVGIPLRGRQAIVGRIGQLKIQTTRLSVLFCSRLVPAHQADQPIGRYSGAPD